MTYKQLVERALTLAVCHDWDSHALEAEVKYKAECFGGDAAVPHALEVLESTLISWESDYIANEMLPITKTWYERQIIGTE